MLFNTQNLISSTIIALAVGVDTEGLLKNARPDQNGTARESRGPVQQAQRLRPRSPEGHQQSLQ